jgi:hypothetical protein
MPGEKDVIQKKAEPMDELSNGPNCVKQQEENNTLSCQAGGGVF